MTTTSTTADRASALIEALWNDQTAAGKSLRAKAKEMFPDVVTPEDHVDPVVAPLRAQMEEQAKALQEMREERAAERKAAQEASETASLRQKLDNARNHFNLTDEGLDKVVAHMKETGNYTDAMGAAALIAGQNPPTQMRKSDFLPKKLDLFGSNKEVDDANFRLLHTNPEAYMDSQLEAFVNDPEGFTNETLGLR